MPRTQPSSRRATSIADLGPSGPVTFSVSGHPQGKGRARAFRRGSFIGHYTPEKTRTYEGILRTAATDAMEDHLLFLGPVSVQITAVFDIPKSFSQTKQREALANVLKPTKRPDIDNIVKACLDAMNGVVFKDDCQIVRGEYAKVYGPAPMVVVTVRAA